MTMIANFPTPTQARLMRERRERLERMNKPPRKLPVAAIVDEGPSPLPENYIHHVEPATRPLHPAWREVGAQCANKYGMTFAMLREKNRIKAAIMARHEFAYRMRVEFGFSLPRIGTLLGGMDHATIINAVKKHAERIGADHG